MNNMHNHNKTKCQIILNVVYFTNTSAYSVHWRAKNIVMFFLKQASWHSESCFFSLPSENNYSHPSLNICMQMCTISLNDYL